MTILCTKTPKDFSELKSEIYHSTTNNSNIMQLKTAVSIPKLPLFFYVFILFYDVEKK